MTIPMDKQMKGSVSVYLETVRRELGEASWKAEIKKLALQAFRMGGPHEAFWREQIKDFDWINADELKELAASLPAKGPDVNNLITQALKLTMPGLKTQAQYNTYRAALDAFQAVVGNIFNGDAAKEAEARSILDTAFVACKQATDLAHKLGDVPEAATSKSAEEHKRPPSEFQEYDVQQQLLGELGLLQSLGDLQNWYQDSKQRRDSVKSQMLRDILMDAIRARKLALTQAEPPKDLS
jgi:hypothetical protein